MPTLSQWRRRQHRVASRCSLRNKSYWSCQLQNASS